MLSGFPHQLWIPLSSGVETSTLNLESTLQELSLYDFQVDGSVLGREIAEAFNANPLLPGVILTDSDRRVGMMSRRQFFERVSRPYGLELFFKRPIEILYRFARTDYLQFASDRTIVMATQRVLQRSPDLLYEPIVVEIAPQVYRLLDVHQLLLAHSQIHALATELLKHLYQQIEVANQELQLQANLDGLTQVANRRMFDRYLDAEWQRMAREKAPLSLILCDIDFFKPYNDTYGHQGGDRCLRAVARVLSERVRRPTDLVARYGGEEFAVILPNTSPARAIAVAEAMRAAVKALAIANAGASVCAVVTLSLGIATMIPTECDSPETLIASADQALYRAKEKGRDRCVLWDSTLSKSQL